MSDHQDAAGGLKKLQTRRGHISKKRKFQKQAGRNKRKGALEALASAYGAPPVPPPPHPLRSDCPRNLAEAAETKARTMTSKAAAAAAAARMHTRQWQRPDSRIGSSSAGC